MADPMSNDDSISGGGMQPYVPDFGDGGLIWDFGTPNPSSDSIDEILNKGLGPLSDEAINGSPLLYTNPQAYFAALRVNNPGLFADTVSGGSGSDDGGELAGSVWNPNMSPHFPRTASQNEFNLDYAPPGSLLRYDPVHPFSGDEGPSIYVTAHPAFRSWDPEYHTAIRIVGDDGVVDTLGGQWGSTGNLVSAPNYAGDQEAPVIVRLPVPTGQTPQQFADNLRAAAASYGDSQHYNPLPGWDNKFNEIAAHALLGPAADWEQSFQGILPVPDAPKFPILGEPGYNSNSYVAGVIRAAGGMPPSLPVPVPGYGKPLPLNFPPSR